MIGDCDKHSKIRAVFIWLNLGGVNETIKVVAVQIKLKEKNMNKKGFTLLELLVVVIIIGILAGVALPQYKKAVLKAEATQMKLDVAHAVQAAERYYLTNDQWPRSFDEIDIDFVLPSESGHGECMWGVNASYKHKVNGKIGFAFGRVGGRISIISYYLTGKYKCAGFVYHDNQIMCVEEVGTFFGGYPKSGAYCHDILGLDLYENSISDSRYYK
jgi:prepilin-type N-terminal cleavage/methylation domain-containing protein